MPLSSTTPFIQIISQDNMIQKLQAQIEKSILLNMWIGKAITLMNRYIHTLNELEAETDSIARGLKIEACESYFMSSVILFHRCFVDQPTMHLSIEQVTNDNDLLQVYAQVLELRNDEFIHWKGIRSKIEVRYSFEPLSNTEVNFAREIQGNFSDSIGPGLDVRPFINLFEATSKYVEQRRLLIIDKLRKRLAEPQVFNVTQFLNPQGESVIKRS